MSVLIFIIVLVVLVVGHELGHFFAAKWAKMRVLEFGVGFPPKVFGKRFGASETEYTLNWIPFGGFVRIFGEDPSESGPGAFGDKSKLAQAFVLFAGPFANLLLAFILFFSSFMLGSLVVIDSPEEEARAKQTRVVVAEVVPDSPALRADLRAGDQVLSLESGGMTTAINQPGDIQEVVAAADGAVIMTLVRGGKELVVTLEPRSGLLEDEPSRKAIGIATALVGVVHYAPHVALLKAVQTTSDNIVFVVVSLVTLLGSAVTLSADFSQVAGPVGIATLTGEAATFGFGALLSFAALLSINLGIINLFPFPALDGGRLLFLGIEAVTRRKIPSKVAGVFNTVGFALLILLMMAVTVGDIGRLLA